MGDSTAMVVQVLVLGTGATLVMDLWSWLLRRMGMATLDYAMLGRWCGHWFKGVWFHRSIQASAMVRAEKAWGWALHYLTGMVFAAAFVAVVGPQWLGQPSLAPAAVWGLSTVLLPWLLLQPALGAGIAAARTPRPWASRALSLASHMVFGLGLFLSAKAMA